MESIEQALVDRIEKKFGQKAELSDGLSFLGVDSVGMAELTVEIESAFSITVTDNIFHCETVQDLADYIRQRQQATSS